VQYFDDTKLVTAREVDKIMQFLFIYVRIYFLDILDMFLYFCNFADYSD